jgi:hypothetical protein
MQLMMDNSVGFQVLDPAPFSFNRMTTNSVERVCIGTPGSFGGKK